MSCTPARLLANRINAQKSTGPKTPEGKEASRQNALKHGLTGAGVVILGEDVDAVEERAEILQSELAPEGSLMSRLLVHRVAAMSVRAERCVRHETSQIAHRVRTAPEDFDEERRTRASLLLSQIDQDPITNHRRLLAMPEGVDLLLSRLDELRGDLERATGRSWTERHARTFIEATGRNWEALSASRCRLLTEIIVEETDQPDPLGQVDWAFEQLCQLVVAEVLRLEAHRETLDFEAIATSREESPHRALFDPGHAATLARNYEASAERAMYKALKELRETRLEAKAQPTPVATKPQGGSSPKPSDTRPLGSFFPGGENRFQSSDSSVGMTDSANDSRLNPPIHGSESTQNSKTTPSSPPRAR